MMIILNEAGQRMWEERGPGELKNSCTFLGSVYVLTGASATLGDPHCFLCQDDEERFTF